MFDSHHDDVTVVVTNHDYGRFLQEAVASVLAQDGGPPRVVIVDDGSTDPFTLAVLDDLPANVRVHRQANAGVVAARNAGIALAETPYLLILDADDRLTPRALTALRDPLDSEPKLGFSYGVTRFFGLWEGEMTMPPYDAYKLLYRHTIGVTALMRCEVVDAVGGFDPEFRGYEDWEFWLHALGKGWRGRRVEEVTLEYRRHGSTKLRADRKEYRYWYRRLREKHAALYARSGELARESGLSAIERAIYRWWWGRRPVPARVEHVLHSVLWGRAKQRRARAA